MSLACGVEAMHGLAPLSRCKAPPLSTLSIESGAINLSGESLYASPGFQVILKAVLFFFMVLGIFNPLFAS